MDDLWNEPAVASRPAARSTEPLFLPSDDEQGPEGQPGGPKPGAANEDEEFENIFAELDEILQSTEAMNPQDLRTKRVAEATGTTNTGEEASSKDQSKDDKEEKPKPKRTIAKVDEERLLSERGFPALIKEAKKFKPKGKGHEAADLDRLMEIYQFWAHHMFPKTQFRDTVDRVERVCRSRRMLINMSMWRDADGQISQPPRNLNDSDASNSEQEEPALVDPTPSNPGNPNPTQPVTQTSTRRVIEAVDDDDLWADVNEVVAAAESNPQPPMEVPENATQPYPDDDELEAWFDLNKNQDPTPLKADGKQASESNSMEIDPAPNTVPQRFVSLPTADNWDEDLFV